MTNEHPIPVNTPAQRTVIVQALQAIQSRASHGIASDWHGELTDKIDPLPDDGYRITHVDTCRVDERLVLTTLVLMKDTPPTDSYVGKVEPEDEDGSLRRQLVDTFIAERLEVTGDPDDIASTKKLYAEYRGWRLMARRVYAPEMRPLDITHFGRHLTTRNVGSARSPLVIDGEKVRVRTGVRFK